MSSFSLEWLKASDCRWYMMSEEGNSEEAGGVSLWWLVNGLLSSMMRAQTKDGSEDRKVNRGISVGFHASS